MSEREIPPLVGVLTRTLVKSPVIRSIIPAQILDASFNDIILVRNRSIEIKAVIREEIDSDPYLQDVMCKQDFESNIRTARIFGRQRTYEKIDKSAEGVPWQEEIIPRTPYQQDPFVVPELPPHILALTLESSKLVFLCAFYDWGGHPRWLSNYRVLPDHARSYSKQLGEHLAVDPRSRAMAVAANEGFFALYALKPMDQLKEELETVVGLQSANFDPIMDERFFQIEGVILKMEFLHPPKADPDEVILLVIAAKGEKTKLHIYLWNSSTSLRQATKLGSGQILPPDQRLPLLLIPLTIPAAFMLVFPQELMTYTGILTGPAKGVPHELRHWEEPEQPGSSKSLPIFTQWARVLRRADRLSDQDDIYLCREDGVVRFLEVGDNLPNMIESHHLAGHLDININTAFATFDIGARFGSDLLIAGGDLSHGGLWIFKPREQAKLASTIPNWTPLIDITTAHVPQQPITGPTQKPARVFASTGRGPNHGEITEIRYGVEGAIVGQLDPIGNAVTDLWALHDQTGKTVHILATSLTDTSPLPIRSDDGEPSDGDFGLRVNSQARTIAAGFTMDGCIIQVTATTIIITSTVDREHHLEEILKDRTISNASILTSDSYGCILLTTTQAETGTYLHCTGISTNVEEISLQELGKPIEVTGEPCYVSLYQVQGHICAFIGTLTGSLLVYAGMNGYSPCLQLGFKHEFEGDFAICDSIDVITDEDRDWLVCGLRNGFCQTFSLAFEGRMLLTPLESFHFGSTAVKVKADKKQPNRVILTCDNNFCTLEYSDKQPKSATICNILLTRKGQPGYKQGSINSFAQAVSCNHSGDTGIAAGQWFCSESNSFDLVDISYGSQCAMVPRRMYLDGTPTRLTYSERLGRLIILYTRIVIRRDPYHGRPGVRAMEPTFAFLDVDQGLLRPDPDDPENSELRVLLGNGQTQRANILSLSERKPGEKYIGMTEWFPTDGSKTYHMLVMFTMILYVDNRPPTGRLLFFSLSKNGNGQVSMVCKKITDLKAPVTAVIPYGQSSLIYSCGNDVCLHTLKLSSTPREWLPPVILTLQSRAVHLSTQGQFVHVTTAADSTSVLQVGDDMRSLAMQYSDEVARDSIFHIDAPAHGLIIISSKDGTIAGLQRPPRRRISNSMSTAFVADLPGSITRLRRVTRPSWQLTGTSKAMGFGSESIVACTTDGSVYQIEVLEESLWRLLRFITNMARRHPLICPYREKVLGTMSARHARHIEPSTGNKRFMQVDGDILSRLLELGGEEILQDMVEREPSKDETAVDFDTSSDRSRRFWELVQHTGVDAGTFEDVVCWMRGILANVL